MEPVQHFIANAAGTLDDLIEMIDAAFASSKQSAVDRLGAEGIDALFIDAPDDTIPEWGVGGYTHSPYAILVAIDPGNPHLSLGNLTTTLVHEFHHAMRWRGPGCGGDLSQMLVSEGLATLFEEEVMGHPPMYSQIEISDDEVRAAHADLHTQPFNQAKWFYGASGVTKSFGYTLGYRLCKIYAATVGRSAAELLDVAASDLLARVEFAGRSWSD